MTASFVGRWNCSRVAFPDNTLETVQLTVNQDVAGSQLDGFYPQPGRDVTLFGDVDSSGSVWRGSLKLPDNTECAFVFILEADGNFFGGSWTHPQSSEVRPWVGTRLA